MRRVILLLLLSGAAIYADSLTDFKQSCLHANFGTGKYWLAQCLQDIFTAYPAHLTMGTIAPGAGTVAFGPTYNKILPIDAAEISLSGEALISTDTSWLLQTQAMFAIPTARGHRLTSSNPLTERYGLGLGGLLRQAELDAKASVVLRARIWDVKDQWYYGLGPSTSLSGTSKYGQKQFDLRTGLNYPFIDWLSGGFYVDYMRPRIGDPNSGIPLDTIYTPASAPGLNTRDDFVSFAPYVALRVPPHRSFANVSRVGSHFTRM